MSVHRVSAPLAVLLVLLACVTLPHPSLSDDGSVTSSLESELRATEIAFAKTMAARDHGAFKSFLADEAVFFSGETALRGAQAVAEAWQRFYQDDDAPFSWAPEAVAVLESGTLGLSSGPVFDADGNRVGTFNSVWRRNEDGKWKIVFDRGCDCP